MASIFIFNRSREKCVELSTPRIVEADIAKLKSTLPSNLEGIAFASPVDEFKEKSHRELRVENRPPHVAEYLKNIGQKLESLQQPNGALACYDLAFRLSRNSEFLITKARLLSQHGQAEEAQQLLKEYVSEHSDDPEPYWVFGTQAISRTDYAQARRYFLEAQQKIRPQNVQHRNLKEVLDIYLRFVNIYLDRDQLFSRNLPPLECIQEIQKLKLRTQELIQQLEANPKPDLQGMASFLQAEEKTFEKWLEEMQA